MYTLTTVEARRRFANLISRVWFTKERVALTRYGQAIVAVVPIEDLPRLEASSPKSPTVRKPRSQKRRG